MRLFNLITLFSLVSFLTPQEWLFFYATKQGGGKSTNTKTTTTTTANKGKATSKEKKADVPEATKAALKVGTVTYWTEENGEFREHKMTPTQMVQACLDAKQLESNISFEQDRRKNFTSTFGNVFAGIAMRIIKEYPALSTDEQAEVFEETKKEFYKYLKAEIRKTLDERGEKDRKNNLPSSCMQAASDVKNGIRVGVDVQTYRTWRKIRDKKMELSKPADREIGQAQSLTEARTDFNSIVKLVTSAEPALETEQAEKIKEYIRTEFNKALAKLAKETQKRVEKAQTDNANKAAEPEQTEAGTTTATAEAA